MATIVNRDFLDSDRFQIGNREKIPDSFVRTVLNESNYRDTKSLARNIYEELSRNPRYPNTYVQVDRSRNYPGPTKGDRGDGKSQKDAATEVKGKEQEEKVRLEESEQHVEQLIEKIQDGSIFEPFKQSGLIDVNGNPLSQDSHEGKELITTVRFVSDELLRKIKSKPEIMHTLDPRKFEEVIAELFYRQGYEVMLTPYIKDGGIDIYAVRKDTIGSVLCLVDCKKYRPDFPVDVKWVREMFGLVTKKNASLGVLATTSYFTSEAQKEQEELKYRISLINYIGIQEWLNMIKIA